MELFLQKIDKKIDTKMHELKEDFMKHTSSITSSITSAIEEKLNPLVEENLKLNSEVSTLKMKISKLEREVKKNNILLHGLEETEKNNNELMTLVVDFLNKIVTERGIREFDMWEISEIQRLGKKEDNKRRPILVKLTLAWRKLEILRNNKYFPASTYATEDFPKEVLKIRKELKQQQQQERKNGNLAIIRYDKLIIKGKINQEKGIEKRKRAPSNSPPQSNNDDSPQPKAPNKINKTNAFEYMNRSRQNSQTGNNKQ